MRRVVLGLAVSLDGFIEGPGGEYDWCFTDQDYGLKDFFKRTDSVFMGRKSYELVQGMKGGSGLPKMSTYVFSNTLSEVKKGVTLVSGDIKTEVEKIKRGEGKDIWLFGGASLTTAFINEGLIDEFWLSVHPILLGAGKPLFHDIRQRTMLELVESKAYDTGLVSLKYAPANKQAVV